MCVAEISEDTVQGKCIKKFSDIHLVFFKKYHMVLLQYYDIGSAIIEPYGNGNFISAITEVKPFSAWSQTWISFHLQRKSNKIGHYATFYFAQKFDVISQVFENKEDLEKHLIKGCVKTGDNDAPRLSIDNVKSIFASKMVYSSHKQVSLSNNQVCLAETGIKRSILAKNVSRTWLSNTTEKGFQISKLYNNFTQSYSIEMVKKR